MFAAFLDLLVRYQLILVGVALVAGLASPEFFLSLNSWNGVFLQIIMFATGLRLDLGEFIREVKDWRTLLLANGMMMVLLPFLVSIPLSFFAPEWVLPFVLAAAMPTGLTAPAVVTILGGRTSLAVLISTSTSILAPLLVPLVLRTMASQTVTVDIIDMMLNIAWVVIFPLALSAVIQWRGGKQRIQKFDIPIRLANLAAFALVIVSVTASSAISAVGSQSNIFFSLGVDGLIIILLMLVFWLGMSWLASAMLAWRNTTDRVTVAFCLIYTNTTLGIWIADRFFHETNMAPKLIAIFIATTIILPIFKLFLPKDKRNIIGNMHAVEQL